MNDVVERVARAISVTQGLKAEDAVMVGMTTMRAWESRMPAARAAIEAMREPTEAMLEAVKPWPAHWPKDGPDYPARHAAYLIDQATARSDWQAMLSAALADASPDIGKEGKH